jgi:hypothetical protein
VVSPTIHPGVYRPTLQRFTVVYLATVLGVVVVSVALEILAGIELPSSGTGFVPTIVGVYAAATVFVKQHGRATTPADDAHLAKWCTVLTFALSAVLLGVLLAIGAASGEDLSSLAPLWSLGAMAVLLLVLTAVFALVYGITRLMFRLLTQQIVKPHKAEKRSE